MICVVKLGGSLAETGALAAWLSILTEHGAGRVVIVPGGGDFAETVRTVQRRVGFSDRAAHRMALLAMHEYALLLADLAPGLRPCVGAAEIEATLSAGGIALWLPAPMVEADPGIEASWEVTSDSLAAWLARRIGANHLILIKSAPVRAETSAAQLAGSGLVDAAFASYVADAGFAVTCCGPGDEARLARMLLACQATPSF